MSAPQRKPRTRNRRGEGGLLRDEIVAAAERILEREGAEDALTLRSVAREAGISAPSIYAHFEDRDAILAAVLDLAFERLRQLVVAAKRTEDDPVARLLRGCRAYVEFGLRDPARYRVLFHRVPAAIPAGEQLTRDTVGDSPRWGNRLEAFQTLVDGIAGCVAAGRSASTDPFVDATSLWTALHGAVTMRLFVPGFPWPPLDPMLEATVRRLALIKD